MSRESAPGETVSFGRYQLLHRLASGGMGSVYLARASGPAGFEKLVALKRIHEHMASDSRFVSMFLDEARIAARIQHPNVCSVIDFGEIDGAYYLTMPYIFGEPLHRVIAAAAIRTDETGAQLPFMISRLVADACEGLHAAHELRDEEGRRLNVVHRDISPHNLMVGYDGVVRVLDFGVASAEHRHYQTATGEVKGKIAYCSPEQIEARDLDRRSDIWSLGVVLWEGVAGRRLFGRPNMMATVRAISDMDIPPLRQLSPLISEELAGVAHKALSPTPEGRFATARDMGRAIQTASARMERFVTAADVAEWMSELFPEGRQRKQELIELTSMGDLPLAAGGASGLVEAPAVPSPAPPAADPSAPASGGRLLLIVGMLLLVPIGIAAGMGLTFWITQLSQPSTRLESGALPEAPAPPTASDPDPGGSTAMQVGPVVVETDPIETDAVEPTPAVPEIASPEIASPAGSAQPEGSVPSRRPTRPRPAAAAPGQVNVATPGGWGIAFHRGRRLGEVPGVFTLPSGSTVIEIAPRGRGPRIRRRVRVPANRTAHVVVPIP